MYGSDFPKFKVSDDTAKYVPKGMDNEHIAQTWFRILHLIKYVLCILLNLIFSFCDCTRYKLFMLDFH